MNNLKVSMCTALGVVGGFMAQLYGGWSADMATLGIFMVIDFAIGLALALVFKRSPKTATGAAESNQCAKGLCKKGVALLVVLAAHRLDISLGTEYIKTATIIGFIVNEAISIIENAGLIGVPMPKAVKNAIEVLRNKGDET